MRLFDSYAKVVKLRRASNIAIQTQLVVQLFNIFNRWYVEATKMIAMSAGILHGYVRIRFGHNNPVIAAFCLVVHVDVCFIYVAL